jgi:hypothetical protein
MKQIRVVRMGKAVKATRLVLGWAIASLPDQRKVQCAELFCCS